MASWNGLLVVTYVVVICPDVTASEVHVFVAVQDTRIDTLEIGYANLKHTGPTARHPGL
jgi:hypothetical protein